MDASPFILHSLYSVLWIGYTCLLHTSYIYLLLFNGLWVVFPGWILWEAYCALSAAMSQAEMVDLVNYLKKDD